ncbi:hypothetical protein [Cytobacillus firmus]|uniref:hypothetical protein n=1 Tax=Cytobacillus firmus TaxID=1399 RepID=UPI000B18519C|nr:hypothetical protein [Cytobacillus firmus]
MRKMKWGFSGIGMAYSLSLGLVFGMLFENWALGIAMGVAFGASFWILRKEVKEDLT